VKVEPLEFTSSGGRGEALFRFVKSHFLTFYEVINIDNLVKNKNTSSRGKKSRLARLSRRLNPIQVVPGLLMAFLEVHPCPNQFNRPL
jgi:hypothetical protein